MVDIKRRFKNPELRKKRISEARLKLSREGKLRTNSETLRKLYKEKKLTHPMKNKKQKIKNVEKMKQTIINQFKNGREVWNKGLTKITDKRIKEQGLKNSITRKKLIKERKVKFFGNGINPSRPKEKNYWFGKKRNNELNPNWQGGLSRLPYSIEWTNELREEIRNLYNRECQLCGRTENKNQWGKLIIHHINYNKQDCNKNNLIPLCTSCNFKVNYDRLFWENLLSKKINKEVLKWQKEHQSEMVVEKE